MMDNTTIKVVLLRVADDSWSAVDEWLAVAKYRPTVHVREMRINACGCVRATPKTGHGAPLRGRKASRVDYCSTSARFMQTPSKYE
jgi:hypothetical protein